MAAVAHFPLPAKRKRTVASYVASYVEGNNELDRILHDDLDVFEHEEEGDEDIDLDYGSRKVYCFPKRGTIHHLMKT